MASWMIHLRVADLLLDRIPDLDETAFVMGNIAPDSGTVSPDWSQYFPPKSVSHFKLESGEYDLPLTGAGVQSKSRRAAVLPGSAVRYSRLCTKHSRNTKKAVRIIAGAVRLLHSLTV